MGTLTRRPFLQAFDTDGNYLTTVCYAGPFPTGPGQIGPAETLTITSPTANIATARWSVQNPGTTYPPVYGLFDNFQFGPPNLALTRQGRAIDFLARSRGGLEPGLRHKPGAAGQLAALRRQPGYQRRPDLCFNQRQQRSRYFRLSN